MTIERNSVPIAPAQKRKEQEKLDRTVAELERERLSNAKVAAYWNERTKDREFLLELPDGIRFSLRSRREDRRARHLVIAASPKPGYRAKHGDAKAFSKIQGRLWIDKLSPNGCGLRQVPSTPFRGDSAWRD